MRLRSATLALLFWVAGFAGSVLAQDENLEPLLEALAAETVVERRAAQARLTEAAIAEGENGVVRLLGLYKKEGDPERKRRLKAALKTTKITVEKGEGAGFLGIQYRMVPLAIDDSPNRLGVLILDVHEKTPAAEAGLQLNDTIIDVDGIDFHGVAEIGAEDHFRSHVTTKRPGDTVAMTILRTGIRVKVEVTLGRFPEQMDRDRRNAIEQRFDLQQNNLPGRRMQLRQLAGPNEYRDEETEAFEKWLAAELEKDPNLGK